MSVDGVVIANDSAEIAAIDDAIDVEPLPTGVATNLVGLATFDPAVAGYRIVVRMSGIHEVNSLFRFLVGLEFVIRFNEGALLLGISFTGDEFWLFVDKPKAVQHLGDAAFAIADLPSLLDVVSHLFGRQA